MRGFLVRGENYEKITLFYAKGLIEDHQDLDDEAINVIWITREGLEKAILSGDVDDPKTIAALYLAKGKNFIF